ncbi:MAG TPA: cysteine desulfurase family protein [Gemmataceae bacterium]|jgi:cysteine desulfurase|nr:cysteine desulfurase family protein [Gemmataceae bacterium]
MPLRNAVMIYLDYNSTTPMRPEVLEAMRPWLLATGNAASAHSAGRKVRQALEDAREKTAALLGAFPDEVIFTSGATEANNLAIFGLCDEPPGHILASPLEHPCVIEPLKELAESGFEVEWLPVTSEGTVPTDVLADRIREDTRLICVMLANHETGAINRISDCASQNPGAKSQKPRLHTDAAQAVGKIPVNFHQLGVTSLSASAHKFYGPPGIGLLLLNRCTKLKPLLHGGHQQQGRRPGTESAALAVGLAKALELALTEREATNQQVLQLRRQFLAGLEQHCAPVVLNGPAEGGLPQTLNISFPGCRADALLMALDLAGVSCSTGSACSSGSLLPSPVLRAIGISDERLHSAMRFSLGFGLSEADIDEAICRIAKVVHRLRKSSENE